MNKLLNIKVIVLLQKTQLKLKQARKMLSKNIVALMMFVMILTVKSASTNECLHPCTYIYQPVCADNGNGFRFFGNECLMEAVNDCDGECKLNEIII